MIITVTYTSVDRVRIQRFYKRLETAQRFAQKWVGRYPEIGSTYAISSDGVGKITCEGCSLSELFQ